MQPFARYDWFNREFRFDKRSSTTVGHVNGFDESLFVQLAARRHRLIDAARWWNPLGRDRQPQYDWHDFRRAYDDASREVARHRWVEACKRLHPGRTVEIQVFGTEIGETKFELKTFLVPRVERCRLLWSTALLVSAAPAERWLCKRTAGSV